jgi:ABC-type bacteriocin/lantibiotic exporter with double-glycine peptidase domain
VEKGVKIYFDAIETEARVQLNKKLIEKVFHDPASVLEKYKPDAVEQLVSTTHAVQAMITSYHFCRVTQTFLMSAEVNALLCTSSCRCGMSLLTRWDMPFTIWMQWLVT